MNGLTGTLASLSQSDVGKFFEPFGEIIGIEVPRDSSGKNKGHAIIEFTTHKEAKLASQSMNGFEVGSGQTLRVNILTDGPTIAANYKDQGGEDLNDVYIKSASARTQLM